MLFRSARDSRFRAALHEIVIAMPRDDAAITPRRFMNLLIENEAALELEQHVQERVGGRVRNLRVFRRAGQLVLEGFSRSFHAKQLATHAILELGPGDELLNRIVVERNVVG